MTETRPYEIQTQNGDAAIPVPLGELAGLRSETNGRASIHNDVYLYFNLGSRLERYFEGSLEDVGPDREAGLPTSQQGSIYDLLSYPGKVFAAIDAGTDGYSSVLVRRGSGWQHVYEAPKANTIYAMYSQVVPGSTIDRLWLNVGGYLAWLPLPSNTSNPLNDGKYRYTHEGYIITGWITAGFLDVVKLYKSLKLFTQNLTADKTIVAEYQTGTDTLTSAWTALPTTYTTSPGQEVNIATNYVQARRLRLRLRFYTNNNASTPVLNSYVLDALLSFPSKMSFSFTLLIEDDEKDASGTIWDYGRAETKYNQLKTWLDTPTPLTFRNWNSPFDNKQVKIDSLGAYTLKVDPLTQKEVLLATITLLEI